MHPRLASYLAFQVGNSPRRDVLRAVEEDADPALLAVLDQRRHPVWETCTWMQLSGRVLVRRANGTHRILPRSEIGAGDQVLPGRVVPCRLRLRDGQGAGATMFRTGSSDLGTFAWEPTDQPTNRWMYDRGDPHVNQAALREALPALYQSFKP
jgi:hypothetical protein